MKLDGRQITLMASHVHRHLMPEEFCAVCAGDLDATRQSIFSVTNLNGAEPVASLDQDTLIAAFKQPGRAVLAALDVQLRCGRRTLFGSSFFVVSNGLLATPSESELSGSIQLATELAKAANPGQILVLGHAVDPSASMGVKLTSLGYHKLPSALASDEIFQVDHPALLSVFPPPHSFGEARSNLPCRLAPFFGRCEEVAELRDMLQYCPIVNLTGCAGVGKSALAWRVGIEALNTYPDGVWLVSLARSTKDEDVLGAIAKVLWPHQRLSNGDRAWISQLRHMSVLLILDDCDHVRPGVSRFCKEVCACPYVRLLVPTRERLQMVDKAYVYRVPPLGVPETASGVPASELLEYAASRVFVDRLLAKDPAFTVSGKNAAAVSEICRLVGGRPSALEFAASLATADNLPEVVSYLRESSSSDDLLMRDPRCDLIRWAYDELSPIAQRALACLSVFAGTWSFAAARFVCSAHKRILSALQELARSGLVRLWPSTSGEMRFELSAEAKQFAIDRFQGSSTWRLAQRMHKKWFLCLLESYSAERGVQEDWLDRIGSEYPDVLAAITRAFDENRSSRQALRFFTALGEYWIRRGQLRDGQLFADKAMELAQKACPCTEAAKALNMAGTLLSAAGRYEQALVAHERAYRLALHLGDTLVAGMATANVAIIERHRGDLRHACRTAVRAVHLLQKTGARRRLAAALNNLGAILEDLKRYPAALSCFRKSARMHDEIGDAWSAARITYNMAEMQLNRCRLAEGAELAQDCLQKALDLKDLCLTTLCLRAIALTRCGGQHREEAVVLLSAAKSLGATCGAQESPHMLGRLERSEKQLCRDLGEAKFRSLWESAKGLSFEEAAQMAS